MPIYLCEAMIMIEKKLNCSVLPCSVDNESFVFISYAHDDSAVVFPVIEHVSANGYALWYDRGINISSVWTDDVAIAILKCKAFLLFVSKEAVESIYVRSEVEFALNNKIRVIPVYLDSMEVLPPGLALGLSATQGITDIESHQRIAEQISNALEYNKIKRCNEIAPSKKKAPTGKRVAPILKYLGAGVFATAMIGALAAFRFFAGAVPVDDTPSLEAQSSPSASSPAVAESAAPSSSSIPAPSEDLVPASGQLAITDSSGNANGSDASDLSNANGAAEDPGDTVAKNSDLSPEDTRNLPPAAEAHTKPAQHVAAVETDEEDTRSGLTRETQGERLFHPSYQTGQSISTRNSSSTSVTAESTVATRHSGRFSQNRMADGRELVIEPPFSPPHLAASGVEGRRTRSDTRVSTTSSHQSVYRSSSNTTRSAPAPIPGVSQHGSSGGTGRICSGNVDC
jgi:hypothetical protein